MKIIVTGATGFIGNHVINELLKIKDVEILAIFRNIEKAKKFPWFGKIKYLEHDLKTELPNKLQDYDTLIHLAWSGLPNYKSLFHFEKNLFESYFFLKNLIMTGLKNVNVIGTCFEYGMQNGCLSEELDSKPTNPYGLAKDTLRRFLEELKKIHPFSLKWIRLFYMFGEGQNEKSLFYQLNKSIVAGEKTFNMSEGQQIRDYLPIEKVAEYIVKISLQTEIKGIINCCSGKPQTVKGFVEGYLNENSIKMNLNLGYYPYPDYEPMSFWGNKNKLEMVLRNYDSL